MKWETILYDDNDRLDLIAKLEKWTMTQPCDITIRPHKKNRSLAQNALFAVWARERGEQIGTGETHERRYLKLAHGVPIMLAHDDFREFWQVLVESAPSYEEQLHAMDYVDVTSLMTTAEMTQFLNEVEIESYENGLHLTKPRQYDEAMR